ncbi:methyltransferase domain-containing protein [Streptomyces spororaveus]|uniref:Protein-L-isoaspartate O-methyltransferase n=1 Tax=Streptomyces spororaveus TaxID=284039 RepID=A0ABQ3TAD7_9ACTN|nr:protein-L-isoaspartate(D-aspartate) O-methyltransferase [Streptomyces spororaveus]GHI77329.1 protein-L-isoaspartate O-methyltransferase [Streptomyces spororaveus]
MTKREEGAGPQGLASALVASGALQRDWSSTFHAVPRDMFVPARIWPGIASGTRQRALVDRDTDPDAWLTAVYSDIPLTTQWDDGQHTGDDVGTTPTSSNSRPHMVFSMLSDLDVREGHRVLEIGTGTGWNAGLLAHRLGCENVVSIEYGPEVAKGAAVGNLRDAGLSPLVIVGDGRRGQADGGPYDRAMATCSVGDVPYAWIQQTRTGGITIAPWGTGYGGEAIARLVVGEDGTASGHFTRSSAFMRLRQQRPDRADHAAYLKGQEWPGDGVKSTTTLSPEGIDGWAEQFAISLRVPGTFWSVEHDTDGSYVVWFYGDDRQSWASVDYEPGASEYLVVQSGPRKLWDETEAAYRWWEEQGRPDFTRFGLTVGPDGQTPWLDLPNNPV